MLFQKKEEMTSELSNFRIREINILTHLLAHPHIQLWKRFFTHETAPPPNLYTAVTNFLYLVLSQPKAKATSHLPQLIFHGFASTSSTLQVNAVQKYQLHDISFPLLSLLGHQDRPSHGPHQLFLD